MESACATVPATGDFGLGEDDRSLIGRLKFGGVGGGEASRGELAGTRALMLALLEDAIRCFLGSQRLLRQEAEVWMTMRQQNWPFSFHAVCQVLGLEPSAVRAALQRMREQNLTARRALGRSRPNSGRRTRVMSARRVGTRRRRGNGQLDKRSA